MTVLLVGLSHATAPLAIVERAGFMPDDAAATLACITTGHRVHTLPLSELIILSTCHRVELYGVTSDEVTKPSVALDAMSRVLSARVGPDTPLDSQLRQLVGTEATRHLFRVATGLESIVVGESEVLAQVSASHALSLRIGAAGQTLTPLFEAAVRAGRRARAETAIATVPASVSSIAAELAEELAEELRGRRALFVGGGKIGRLAAKSLRARGFWDMSIVAPASDDGAALASDLGATEVQPDGLARAIAESDLVFTCAGSPVVDVVTVRQAMRGRMARPIAFIDLTPGEVVDPRIAELAGVRLVTPEELRERIDVAIAGRRREAPQVETIVEEELRVLQARTDGSSLSGVVAALRSRAEEIRQRELARALAGLPDADAAVQAQMEWLSVSLVNKLLDEPTRRLRAEATQGPANLYADATRELFGLPGERADRPRA
ncbi:MAG TPA: glutamyl-tRNA reductase [Gemmatimonadaceae bacterium]|nr:glutamyl-tRNA reductase [Gemmatimonadaceae bacterium]